MSFGIYVHIPYCLQRCVYCDFATYEFSQILKPEDYVSRVEKEVRTRSKYIGPRKLDTLYFGGGTPSLLSPPLLGRIISVLHEEGFTLSREALPTDTEVTLEINPATTNEDNLLQLREMGFNRFSVGAQTFDEEILKIAHRKHSAKDTLMTLELLKKHNLNFSVDLLFALPKQDMTGLKKDLEIINSFEPPHVSPYCLTVPESNPMAKGRPLDEIQVEMFTLIKNELEKHGHSRYEISNFSKPGAESKHNMLYWNDDEYWGIGLSSHSYMHWNEWGTRFWNPRGIDQYVKNTDEDLVSWKKDDLHENLAQNQALTDYSHTSLRKKEGISYEKFLTKFGLSFPTFAEKSIKKMVGRGWAKEDENHLRLTDEGILLSNQVFEEFTYLKDPSAVDKKAK